MIFFTSDLHLGHGRILELCPNRSATLNAYNIDSHDTRIMQIFNETVSANDTTIFVGDVMMGGTFWDRFPSLTKFNGRKILVVGNHDRPFNTENPENFLSYVQRFKEAADNEEDRIKWCRNVFDKRLRTQIRDHVRYEQVFDEIYHGTMPFTFPSGRKAQINHFPFAGDSHGEDRFQNMRPKRGKELLIHGHTHSSERWANGAFHVGWDAHGRPISEKEIDEFLLRETKKEKSLTENVKHATLLAQPATA